MTTTFEIETEERAEDIRRGLQFAQVARVHGPFITTPLCVRCDRQHKTQPRDISGNDAPCSKCETPTNRVFTVRA
jgi:hypothetical protein